MRVLVVPRTVQGELGHRSGDMIEQVYGRLGSVRHKSEVVEYRVNEAAPAVSPIEAAIDRAESVQLARPMPKLRGIIVS